MADPKKRSYQILRRREVEKLTGLSRSTIYDKINPKAAQYDPLFPKPISLAAKSVGWIESEVHAWVDGRAAMRKLRS